MMKRYSDEYYIKLKEFIDADKSYQPRSYFDSLSWNAKKQDEFDKLYLKPEQQETQ